MKNACMNDVHMTVHDHDHDHDHLHDTTTKGWRFGGSSPWMSHHPVVRGKDTHGTLGPVRGKAVGGPNKAPKGEVTRHDASLNHDNRQVFRQTWWRSRLPPPAVTTQQVTDQSATIEQFNTVATESTTQHT